MFGIKMLWTCAAHCYRSRVLKVAGNDQLVNDVIGNRATRARRGGDPKGYSQLIDLPQGGAIAPKLVSVGHAGKGEQSQTETQNDAG